MNKYSEKGYIALIAVLVLGAVSLAASLSLLTNGVDNQKIALADQQSKQARAAADACGEEALQVIQANTAFTGTGNLSLGNTNCTYTVTSTGASTRTITASGTSSDVVRKIVVYATISTSSISVSSWQEVSDL